MNLRRRRRARGLLGQKVDEAPMTPMIDVVFQLLIFFMLTMNFKEVEGKLLSQLPKNKGPRSSIPIDPEFKELRIVICADGDTRMHLHDKGGHEEVRKLGEICTLMVEKHPVGRVFRSESEPDRAAGNNSVYRAVGRKSKELYAHLITRAGKPAPAIIDADSEVPYEHVIGVVNALKEADIHRIEFAANSKFTRYYLGQ